MEEKSLDDKINDAIQSLLSKQFLYNNDEEFETCCMDIADLIVGIDARLTREDAIIISEQLKNRAKNTPNAELFENVYEGFIFANDVEYNNLRHITHYGQDKDERNDCENDTSEGIARKKISLERKMSYAMERLESTEFLYNNRGEFEACCSDIREFIVGIDVRLTRKEAITISKILKMNARYKEHARLFNRVYKDFKRLSDEEYNNYRKELFQ